MSVSIPTPTPMPVSVPIPVAVTSSFLSPLLYNSHPDARIIPMSMLVPHTIPVLTQSPCACCPHYCACIIPVPMSVLVLLFLYLC